MTIASKTMTLEEYLNYDNGTDSRHELENGKLIEDQSMLLEASPNIGL